MAKNILPRKKSKIFYFGLKKTIDKPKKHNYNEENFKAKGERKAKWKI